MTSNFIIILLVFLFITLGIYYIFKLSKDHDDSIKLILFVDDTRKSYYSCLE